MEYRINQEIRNGFNIIKQSLMLLFLLGFYACGETSISSDTEKRNQKAYTIKLEPLTNLEAMQFKQYRTFGEQLYQTYCANCHKENGEGLAELFPPIANSDYFLENPLRAAGIIKRGHNEEIIVNGVKYNTPMQGFSNLTSIEIAEIITYMMADLNDSLIFIQQKDLPTNL